jgi:hypothetical protein
MPDLLIAVGGTGQHVALAVSRLVFLGVLPEMELAVVDADDTQELSTSLITFDNTIEGNYTKHPLIRGEKIYSPFDKTDQVDPEFHELFLTPNTPPLQQDMFNVCFDEVSEHIRVKDGMFGRPSVGATIFALNRDKEMDPVFERAELATRIFITGSMVGGTGAGLMHQMIKALAQRNRQLYGLIFLRWFGVPRSATKQTINDGTLDRNMRYGLDYFFRDTRPFLKASLLIGLPENPPDKTVGALALEAGKTNEKKHYFHLNAAYAILRLPKIAVTEQTDGSIYAAAYDSEHQIRMYEEDWGGRTLSWYANRGQYVKELLDYASSQKFKAAILDAFGLLGKPKNIGQGLYDAINCYDRKQRKAVVEEVVHTWELLSRQYRFALSWLDEVLLPLPEKLRHPTYTAIVDDDAKKVNVIQTVWAKPFVMGQELLKGPEIARAFHDLLVESFI